MSHPQTRRTALALLPGLLAASAAVCASIGRASAHRGEGVREVAPGVHVHVGAHELFHAGNAGDVSNAGFIVGDRSVAVVDTGGSRRTGEALLKAIRAVTDKPVSAVINTHMHPDHVLGNAAFRSADTSFIAHHKMARGLGHRAERYLATAADLMGADAFAGTEVILPDRAIAEETRIDLGGRTLLLSPQPTAHTDNDLVITDETTGTVFLGDLLFSGHVPTIDGSILGWQTVLADLSVTPAQRVVPGHGPATMAWPEGAYPVVRYLSAIANQVRAMIKAGATISEAMQTAAREEAGQWALFEEFHARNVAAAFAELEWD